MKIKILPSNEQGIAHLELIIVLVAVIGIGGFAALRVSNANQEDTNPSTSQTEISEEAATEGPTAEEMSTDKNAAELEQAEADVDQQATKPLGAAQEPDNETL